MKNSTWKPFCSFTLAIAMFLYGSGIAGAENAVTQPESTRVSEDDKQQNQDQADDQQAKHEKSDSSVAAASSVANVPVAEVEVTADKQNKLTIGQQPDAEGVNNYVVTQSSTGSKSDIENKDLPQSITVVGQKIMKEQNNLTVADALVNVAGISVTQKVPNYYYQSSFNIRGFGGGGTAFLPENIYVDGLWDPCSTMAGWIGNLDRIEVLKGPSSVLYGNGEPGGIINYVSKKPLTDRAFTVGTEYGSWGTKSSDIDMSLPLTDDKKWLSRTILQETNYHPFQKGVESKRFDGSFIVQGKPKDDTTYTFEADFHNHKGSSGYGLLPLKGTVQAPYGLVPYDGNYNNPDVNTTYYGRSVSARVDHRINNIWTVSSALRYSNQSTEVYYQGGSTLNTTTNTVSQTWQHRMIETDVVSWDTTANAKLKMAGLAHDLTFGYDWSRFTQYIPYFYRTMLTSVSLIDPEFVSYSPSSTLRPMMKDYRSHSYRYGSYLSDVVELSPKLKVAAGVSFTDQDSGSTHDSGKAWRVGTTYEISPGINLFTGYSTSYEPQGTVNNGIKTFYLRPVTGDQFEGGVKVDISDRASVTLAAYQINRADVVYAVPGTDPTEYLQIGKQRSKGVELDATYVIRPGWNLLAAYSHCDARVVQDSTYKAGSVLPNVPLNSFRLWSTYEIQEGPRKGLGFGGGVTFAGKRTVDYNNTLGWMDGYTTFDAVVYYKTKDWRYSLNMYNLTNREYWALGSSSGVYAGTPRSFVFRIERSFF